ncbi:MAG: hypothetical protein JJT88_19580 [Gammaproteobacteria bacterium]|nr:hypothetical protein [Gammaproteobacteria bacterium]
MKQVNVSLERTLDNELRTLARYWGMTKTEAVRRLIVDAVAGTRTEKAEYKARKEELQERVKQLQGEQVRLKAHFNEVIEELHRTLDELLPVACLMELVDPDGRFDGDSLSDPDLRELVASKVKDINNRINRGSLLRPPRYKGPFAEDSPPDS